MLSDKVGLWYYIGPTSLSLSRYSHSLILTLSSLFLSPLSVFVSVSLLKLPLTTFSLFLCEHSKPQTLLRSETLQPRRPLDDDEHDLGKLSSSISSLFLLDLGGFLRVFDPRHWSMDGDLEVNFVRLCLIYGVVDVLELEILSDLVPNLGFE